MNQILFKKFSRTHAMNSQLGFTLIETLIAIFILTLTIGALLTLTAGGYFSIRYAKNDIVATNLLQESLEFVRNNRDSVAQTQYSTWANWLQTVQGQCGANGCIINPYAQVNKDAIESCPSDGCDYIHYYPTAGFYGYGNDNAFDPTNTDNGGYATSFVRTITMQETTTTPDPELIVTAHIEWMNGSSKKQVSQSIILTKWNLQ